MADRDAAHAAFSQLRPGELRLHRTRHEDASALQDGTDFLYSGEGINLVQFVIEQKKQKPIDELLREAIFTPLGMTRTGIIYRKEFEADGADRFDSNERFHAQTRRFPARAAGSMTTIATILPASPRRCWTTGSSKHQPATQC